MAVYQLKTFADLISAVREELQVSSSDTTAINRIKRDVNLVYQEVTSEKNWWWLQGNVTLQLPAYVSAGTVSVLQGSSSITFTVAPNASQRGKLFAVDGFNEIYIIESHEAGSTSAKLSELFAGATNPTASYKLWTDRIPLPTDCKETTEVWHDHQSIPLEGRGKQDIRKLSAINPRAEGKPRYYYTGDFVDPAQTASIDSLPGVLTRASSGVIKTLVFQASLPSAVVSAHASGAPLRWNVSGADHPSYNGDIIVSSISTTNNDNDTITYTGKAEHQEPATSDASISITEIDSEADYDRYRELFLYPCLSSSRVTLRVDYVREVFPLESNTDEPAVPLQDRVVLLYGALHRAWSRMRNSEEAARNFQLYQAKLAKMAGKLQDTTDTPRLKPATTYLSAKRSVRGRMSMGGAMGGMGGAGGSNVVTGTPNSMAVFNDLGELQASTIVSMDEVEYLDGLTANIQEQLDSKQPTGDYITSLTGDVTAAGPGAATATISDLDRAKLASGTADHVIINDSSGVLSSEAQLAVSRGGTGANLSTSTGVVKVASGTVSADTIVDADIDAAADISRSKVASGTASHVIINDGTGKLSSEAQLDKARGGTGISSTATFPASGTVATVPSSGVVKSNGSSLSSSNVSLSSEVTGTLPTTNGGTGVSGSATFPSSGTVATVPSSGVVRSNGTALTTGTVALGSEVSGTLPVGSGGTGLTSYTTGDILYASAASTLAKLGIGSTGQVLKVASGLPSWTSAAASLSVVSKTTTYTASADDDVILVSATSGAWTLTLPAASGNASKVYYIKKTDTSGNAVTVSPDLDGASRALYTENEVVVVQSDGTNYQVLSHRTHTPLYSYTPTLNNLTPAGTNNAKQGVWRREGAYMVLQTNIHMGSTGTGSSGNAGFSLPGSWLIKPSALVSGALSSAIDGLVEGGGIFFDSSAGTSGTFGLYGLAIATTTVGFRPTTGGSILDGTSVAANDRFNLTVRLPIQGWWE